MRAVVQRVNGSRVVVDEHLISEVGKGLLVLLGVGQEDNLEDVSYLVDKILNLRIFEDEEGKMNLSLRDIDGDLQVVSQFTLFGDVRKGRRPSFSKAAKPDVANDLYEAFVAEAEAAGLQVKKGKFQAHMVIALENDGPVTILLDSKKVF